MSNGRLFYDTFAITLLSSESDKYKALTYIMKNNNVLLFFMKVYVILELLGKIISSLWAFPLAQGGTGPAYIFINEMGTNLNCKSYLEFFRESGFNDEALLGLFLGVLILSPDLRRKKNHIVAMFDLKEIRDSPNSAKYFVLGNPDDNWTSDTENYYGTSIDCTGTESSPAKKVFGIISEWLEVTENSLKMVFLTGSRIAPITDFALPPNGRNTFPNLEDNDGLIQYLQLNSIDIAIMRGEGKANQDRCFLIDGLYSRQLHQYGKLSPYLSVPKDPLERSENKCGDFKQPFHHLSFHLGERSPGSPNTQGYVCLSLTQLFSVSMSTSLINFDISFFFQMSWHSNIERKYNP